MLHASHTDFSLADASLSLPAAEQSFAASNEVITVSATHSVPLHESTLAAGPQPYSAADMAVFAVAVLGAWMVARGGAMLARHLRSAKQPVRLAQQHH